MLLICGKKRVLTRGQLEPRIIRVSEMNIALFMTRQLKMFDGLSLLRIDV